MSTVPARESAATKARRYVTEGRLTVLEVSARHIRALCKGDGVIYRLGWNSRGWHCNCPALTVDCAHLRALRLVTTLRTV